MGRAVYSTQEDPIGVAGGSNLYGYGAGDPVNNSDPFGLSSHDREAVVIIVGEGARRDIAAARRRDPLFDERMRELEKAPEAYVFFERLEARCRGCPTGAGFSWGGAGPGDLEVPDEVAMMAPGVAIAGAAFYDAAESDRCAGGRDRVIPHEFVHLLGIRRTGRKYHHRLNAEEFFFWPDGCAPVSPP